MIRYYDKNVAMESCSVFVREDCNRLCGGNPLTQSCMGLHGFPVYAGEGDLWFLTTPWQLIYTKSRNIATGQVGKRCPIFD